MLFVCECPCAMYQAAVQYSMKRMYSMYRSCGTYVRMYNMYNMYSMYTSHGRVRTYIHSAWVHTYMYVRT